jgi:hypothetical protein
VVYSGNLKVDRYKILDSKGKKVMQGRVVGGGGGRFFGCQSQLVLVEESRY